MERLLLITTAGPGLLAGMTTSQDRKWLLEIAGRKSLTDEERVRFDAIMEACRQKLARATPATKRRLCAELEGIDAAVERYHPKLVRHTVIHTDSVVGKATADLLAESLRPAGVYRLTTAGLRPHDIYGFRAATAELTRQLDAQVISDYRRQKYDIIFNFSGGFLSLNNYLQTLAHILADRSVFLFESGGHLVEIPHLPVELDDINIFMTNHEIFRKFEAGYPVRLHEVQKLPGRLWVELEGKAVISDYGQFLWGRYRAGILGMVLYPPICKKVRIADDVGKTFSKLEPGNRMQVNEAISEFCTFIELKQDAPSTRAFKKLSGNPYPGSTHELSAWSGGGTGRLYGRFEDDGGYTFNAIDGYPR